MSWFDHSEEIARIDRLLQEEDRRRAKLEPYATELATLTELRKEQKRKLEECAGNVDCEEDVKLIYGAGIEKIRARVANL